MCSESTAWTPAFYGPGDFENTHGYNESVSISAVTKIAQIYLKAAARYFA
jgi:hypothetical protein